VNRANVFALRKDNGQPKQRRAVAGRCSPVTVH
jgi:hypothetical protein